MRWWMTRNLKLQMIVFLYLYFLAVLATGLGMWMMFRDVLSDRQLWWTMVSIPVVLAAFSGFYIAQYLQRRMDRLQLGLIQLHKGNTACRLHPLGKDAFDVLYKQFNL